MTPTAFRLKSRLDERHLWFINDWFFKWHFIGKDGPISIDSFDGRMIHYSGIKFDESARRVYWDTIARGVRKEITQQFAWVDQEVRNYNRKTALEAIDECSGQLASFVRSIRREAVAKDRILRGDGIIFPAENDAGRWEGTSDKDIASAAEALKAALPLPVGAQRSAIVPQTFAQRASVLWHENQWWLGLLGLALAVAGLIPLMF